MKSPRLPQLSALRMFEAAARHLSFSRAADELNVTHGAVSRQIRQLETFVGRPLFYRSTRRVALTAAGARYASAVRNSFEALLHATIEAQRRDETHPLVVSLMDSFAAKWLMPRLPRFYETHAGISVRLHTSDDLVDFWRDGIDLAIRYGNGIYPGCAADLLMDEAVLAVCSPSLLSDPGALKSVEELKQQRLIHNTRHSWAKWFEAAGIEDVKLPPGLEVNHSLLLIEAVLRGEGVALVRRALVESELQAGRLVAPFGVTLRERFSYFVVYPSEAIKDARVRAFRDWLLAEAEAMD
jgi:LysR family transcriptional regulator, glycine cleavage system transcriptional activator